MNLQNTHHPEASFRRLLITAIVVAVVLTIAGLIFKALGTFEFPLSHALNEMHHGSLGSLGNFFYKYAGPTYAVVGTAVITVVIALVRRNLSVASTFAVTVAFTWLSTAVVKYIVHRPRPDASLLPFPYHPIQLDASYPSGHAAFITVLVMALVALFTTGIARKVAVIVGALVIALAAFLLTVDAVHYPTDVLASIVWVLAVAPLVRAIWVRYVLPRIPLLNKGSDA